MTQRHEHSHDDDTQDAPARAEDGARVDPRPDDDATEGQSRQDARAESREDDDTQPQDTQDAGDDAETDERRTGDR